MANFRRNTPSGIIVSTGLGLSGWFKSTLARATRSAAVMGQTLQNQTIEKGFRWDSDFLLYSVREPFPSAYTGTELTFGRVTKRHFLEVISNMPVDGMIFSDGMEQDYLEFNSGQIAKIGVAKKSGQLVL